MAVTFPEAALGPLAYVIIGFLMASVLFLSYFTYRLKSSLQDGEDEELRVDQIGLSHNAEKALETALEEPILQSELPKKIQVSKATVSNAVQELNKRGFIIRKKKSNTYRIEPEREEIRKHQ